MAEDITRTQTHSQPAPTSVDRRLIVLTLLTPEGEKTFRFDKERVVIGSVISADLRLSGDGVAPLHAVLEAGKAPVIYDLASETGIFVNGTKVVTHSLR